jgi:hypothetical protein
MEVDQIPDEGDTMPFLGEDVVMMIYDGCPSSGMRRVCNPSLGTPSLYINICRNIDMYITHTPKAKKGGRWDSLGL